MYKQTKKNTIQTVWVKLFNLWNSFGGRPECIYCISLVIYKQMQCHVRWTVTGTKNVPVSVVMLSFLLFFAVSWLLIWKTLMLLWSCLLMQAPPDPVSAYSKGIWITVKWNLRKRLESVYKRCHWGHLLHTHGRIMGVWGLTGLIEGISGIYQDCSFRGRRLVIDGSNLLNQLYFQSGMNTIALLKENHNTAAILLLLLPLILLLQNGN